MTPEAGPDMTVRAASAEARLADATELWSDERNAITALPYRLMLPLLARRAVYASLRIPDPAFTAVASCERRSLQSFFDIER